ncbi:helix-turn-helix domain-containing protein [Morganella morganii]|uniref:helix-turn-helix domain-containing protein n=1 Tax=Morganella morganii TaxID=582 RepID=UPI003EB6E24C
MRLFLKKINLDDSSLSLSCYIGGLLRENRLKHGLSGHELACNIKISQQQVSRYERGETSFQVEMLFRFFSALRMTESEIQYFFYRIINQALITPRYTSSKFG